MEGEAYSVIDVKKIKSGQQLSEWWKHVRRLRNVPNADSKKRALNVDLTPSKTAIATRLREAIGTATIRKNSVLCVPVLMSFSHEKAKTINPMEWAKASLRFLQCKFGASNVIHAELHLDERTPHLHCLVVPIVEKKNFKNREVRRLDAKGLLFGHRNKLRNLHTEYAEAVEQFGLVRGIRGSFRPGLDVDEVYAGKLHRHDKFERAALYKRVDALTAEKNDAVQRIAAAETDALLQVKRRRILEDQLIEERIRLRQETQQEIAAIKKRTDEEILRLKCRVEMWKRKHREMRYRNARKM